MTDKNTLKSDLFPRLFRNSALVQMGEIELNELIDSIERLQASLYRFTPLLDRQSLEIVTRAQLVLKTIGNEIDHMIVSEPVMSNRCGLERWDNEGGSINHILT